MNPRIIELRKEAWRLVQVDLQTNERDEVVTEREHTKMVFDKFAELIIQECVNVVKESQWTEAKGEYYEGFNEALNYGTIKIKKHFGVE